MDQWIVVCLVPYGSGVMSTRHDVQHSDFWHWQWLCPLLIAIPHPDHMLIISCGFHTWTKNIHLGELERPTTWEKFKWQTYFISIPAHAQLQPFSQLLSKRWASWSWYNSRSMVSAGLWLLENPHVLRHTCIEYKNDVLYVLSLKNNPAFVLSVALIFYLWCHKALLTSVWHPWNALKCVLALPYSLPNNYSLSVVEPSTPVQVTCSMMRNFRLYLILLKICYNQQLINGGQRLIRST